MLPKVLNSVNSLDEWFNILFANSGTPDNIELLELNDEEAPLIIPRFHKVTLLAALPEVRIVPPPTSSTSR